jgi:hypothetical protein
MGMFRCVLITQGCPRHVEASSSRRGILVGQRRPCYVGVSLSHGVSSLHVSQVGERRDGMEGTYHDEDDNYSSSSAVVAPRRW